MIYILKLDRPLNDKHTSQYYIGYVRDREDLYKRVRMHQAGLGARFTQVATERGIDMKIVCLIEGGRPKERQLKARKNARIIVERAKRGTLKEKVLYVSSMA